MPTRQALIIADEQGLDLVEVAPAGKPPVCRLMDYGKFRYEATRKERVARRESKARASNELREIRFRTRIGEHDRSAKVRHVKRLLDQGSKVKVSVMFRGREITHPEVGMAVLKSVAEDLGDDALIERPPFFQGRFLTMILSLPTSRARKAVQQKEPSRAKA